MTDGSHCFAEKAEEVVVAFMIARTETNNAYRPPWREGAA